MKSPLKRACSILGLALPMALFSIGCKKEEAIHSYTAPKENAAPAVAEVGDTPHAAENTTSSSDLGFPADLRWKLPAGWKQVPVPENPFFKPVAAIQVSAEQPGLILTISQLPDSPGARSDFDNVKRWARQLKLPEPTESDVDKYVTHIPFGDVTIGVVTMGGATPSEPKLLGAILPHAQDTWVFKLSGDQTALDAQASAFADFLKSVRFGDSSSGPPVAGPPVPTPESSNPAPAESAATGAGGAKWTLPAGWTAEASSNSFRVATIRPSNGSAEIKVSKLGVGGGGLGANVSRWHGEVGLEQVDDEHADPGQQMKVGDQTWTLHDYTGPANGGTREIVALAEAGGNTWYFKLVGPTDVVAKAKPEFDQFLATVRLGQ